METLGPATAAPVLTRAGAADFVQSVRFVRGFCTNRTLAPPAPLTARAARGPKRWGDPRPVNRSRGDSAARWPDRGMAKRHLWLALYGRQVHLPSERCTDPSKIASLSHRRCATIALARLRRDRAVPLSALEANHQWRSMGDRRSPFGSLPPRADFPERFVGTVCFLANARCRG